LAILMVVLERILTRYTLEPLILLSLIYIKREVSSLQGFPLKGTIY
jgi:hypothetical protein